MNPRIAKDIRLLLLPLLAGIALILGGLVVSPAVSILGWMAASAIMVATVYVGDMTPNGLALALTLPVSRSRLWREKTLVAAVALFLMSSLLSFVYLLSYFSGGFQVVTPLVDVLLLASLPVFFLGAGAAISLWVRQAIATFWLLLLAGGGLFIFSAVVVPWFFPELNIFFFLCALFLTGGFGGMLIAARKFARFEDTGDGSALGHIELGAFTGSHANQRTRAVGFRHLLVLAKKELVLQQINIVLTVGVVIVVGAVALTVPMEFLMMIIWIPKLIALLIAFVVGAVAFAEEERMGISPWMLTFPAKRRTQFMVKLAVSVTGAILLAMTSVLALDALMNIRAISNQFTPIYELRASHFILLGILAPIGACLGGAFTSSFSRNFLAAISHTMLAGVTLYGLYYEFAHWLTVATANDSRVTPHALMLMTGVPTLLILFAAVSWKNFVRESARSKAVTSYITLGVAVATLMVVDTAIFKRSWELLEPSPADAKFATAPAGDPLNRNPIATPTGTYAILRDGSLWCTRNWPRYRNDVVRPTPYRVGNDNDWVDAVGRQGGVFALKSDGSLWMQGEFTARNTRLMPSENSVDWDKNRSGGRVSMPDLTAVAADTRWKNLARGYWYGETIAIRDDGTLWMWGQPFGTNVFPVHIDDKVQMTQLSSDTDWKQVVRRTAIKEDGSLWALEGTFVVFGGLTNKHSAPTWEPRRVEGIRPITELVSAGGGTTVGRTASGEALLLWYPPYVNDMRIGSRSAVGIPIALVNEPKYGSWFTGFNFVLTEDDVVLALRPSLDFGNAWVAINEWGGFTRDGSYWRFHQADWIDRSRIRNLVEWLHLSLRDIVQDRLVPPRWRPKLVGKLGEL